MGGEKSPPLLKGNKMAKNKYDDVAQKVSSLPSDFAVIFNSILDRLEALEKGNRVPVVESKEGE